MRILIVDDDSDRREKLVGFLIESGIGEESFHEVDCSDQAREALRREYYNVLILDVVLPKRSGQRGDQKYGLELLRIATGSRGYRCPEKIIGITAHLDDIASFRASFLEYCAAVVEAKAGDERWRQMVLAAIGNTENSVRSRLHEVQGERKVALTVHGIQTFGAWQRRLRIIARNSFERAEFHTYRYGVYSIPAFFVPRMREREVTRFKVFLQELFQGVGDRRIAIYCHSFGTYIVATALLDLLKERSQLPVHTIALAGSVLQSSIDLEPLRRAGIRVVNDCADHDYVLYLSQALVLGTGMAGKVGFYGLNNQKSMNRFFLGGHSSYFKGDLFMKKFWVPLLSQDSELSEVDLRSHSTLRHSVLDKIFVLFGYLKPYGYMTVGGILIVGIYRVIRDLLS